MRNIYTEQGTEVTWYVPQDCPHNEQAATADMTYCETCGVVLWESADDEMNGPTIHKVTKSRGVAGQYSLTATVQYPGEPASSVTFVGSTYGGPIVMRTDSAEVFVSESVLDRLGRTLDETWVRRFFNDDERA